MSVIPAILLNTLREYNFVGSPLWRMSYGKDLFRVELTFHKNLPTTKFYKRCVVVGGGGGGGGEGGSKAGGSLHPLLARLTQLRQDLQNRRTDPRLRADSLRRRRRHHHQPSRHCRPHHLGPLDDNASHRQQRSCHHLFLCDLQHHLLLKILRLQKQGSSRRSTRQDNQHSTHVKMEDEYPLH